MKEKVIKFISKLTKKKKEKYVVLKPSQIEQTGTEIDYNFIKRMRDNDNQAIDGYN